MTWSKGGAFDMGALSEQLDAMLTEQRQPVTARWLCHAHAVSAAEARAALEDYAAKHSGNVAVTYVLTGAMRVRGLSVGPHRRPQWRGGCLRVCRKEHNPCTCVCGIGVVFAMDGGCTIGHRRDTADSHAGISKDRGVYHVQLAHSAQLDTVRAALKAPCQQEIYALAPAAASTADPLALTGQTIEQSRELVNAVLKKSDDPKV